MIGYTVPLCRVQAVDACTGALVKVQGPNGIGKSTLFKTLFGQCQPLAGSIELSAQQSSTEGTLAAAAHTVYCSANESLAQPFETVKDALVLAAELDFLANDKIQNIADHLGLLPLIDFPISHLSTGQKKRLSLARPLANDSAALLMLDEPFAGLDTKYAQVVSEMIATKAQNAIILYAAHDHTIPGSQVVSLEPARFSTQSFS